MSSWYLFIVIMVALIIGGVVAIPIKVYLFRIVERQGNDIKVTEYIYLSKTRARKDFYKRRKELFNEWDTKYETDCRVTENYSLAKSHPKYVKDNIYDRFKMTAPYKDYDTQDIDMILVLKYLE